jgi:Ca-activated chloride channel family protein
MSPLLLFTLLASVQFTSGVDLVEVYASVTGPDGGAITDLSEGDFEVLEDGAPQRIQAFAQGEFPVSIALAIDRSFSMSGPPLRLAREAARVFLSGLRRDDEALVVAVGSEIEALGELSRDRAQQQAALDALVPWGSTRLHDAILDVVDRVSGGRGRRAVLVLSDGQDRSSRATADDVIDRVRRSDVLVYGITLATQPSPLFAELARVSGGRDFHVTTPQQLRGVFEAVGRELRSQYLIGYARPGGPPGWRRIEVRVSRPGARVRARSGYVAR